MDFDRTWASAVSSPVAAIAIAAATAVGIEGSGLLKSVAITGVSHALVFCCAASCTAPSRSMAAAAAGTIRVSTHPKEKKGVVRKWSGHNVVKADMNSPGDMALCSARADAPATRGNSEAMMLATAGSASSFKTAASISAARSSFAIAKQSIVNSSSGSAASGPIAANNMTKSRWRASSDGINIRQ